VPRSVKGERRGWGWIHRRRMDWAERTDISFS
jgi:hypothetical protein